MSRFCPRCRREVGRPHECQRAARHDEETQPIKVPTRAPAGHPVEELDDMLVEQALESEGLC